MHTISLILHTFAAAVLVGPQLLMFYAVTPATWLIEHDEKLKRDVLRVVTHRFAQLSMIAFAVLVLTGVYQYTMLAPEEIRGWIFSTKMLGVIAMVGMTYWHVAKYGRAIARLSDDVIAGRGDEGELESLRLKSFTFSIALMVVSIATFALGVALSTGGFV